jgi:serine/threonine protein kinase
VDHTTAENIWDTYTRGKVLGEGVTGKVYELVNKETGDRFALKTIDKQRMAAVSSVTPSPFAFHGAAVTSQRVMRVGRDGAVKAG